MSMKQQFQAKITNVKQTTYTFRSQISTVMAILSGMYVLLTLFQIRVLIGFTVFLTSVYSILYFKWKALRQTGIINLVSPKLRQILLKRSIYDIYRDQVYYPYITRIAGTFIRGAVSKPHPQKLDQMFNDLPQNVKNAIFTKGVLKLAPERLQKLVIQKDMDVLEQIQLGGLAKPKIHEIVPKNYGNVDRTWDKMIQYEAEQQKIHENTLSKQVLLTLNDKIHWRHILPLAGLVSFGIMNTKSRKLGKILLYNGSVIGIFAIIALLIIKYKKPNKLPKLQGQRQLIDPKKHQIVVKEVKMQ